jgi:SAM-dependent methyltransferase
MTIPDYVLGTSDAELARLGLQHQLWRAQAYALWERAGFGPGQKLLDVGAGPGYTTLDLAELVGARGEVLGVDLSQRFLDTLAARAQGQKLANVRTLQADLTQVALPPSAFDGAYARWVFCFLPDPDRVVGAIAAALQPGAALVVQDYLDWGTLGFAPSAPIFGRVVHAVQESWRRRGGDPQICARLPALFAKHGLVLEHLQPIVRIARAGEPLWQWPASFFTNYVPQVVEMGLLSATDAAEFDASWQHLTNDPQSFFYSPLLADLVARKP